MRPGRIRFGTSGTVAANNICLSQTPAAGGIQSLTLNGSKVSGGVATFGIAATISITSAADDSGRVFLVKGAAQDGSIRVEAIRGAAAGAALSILAFKTITSIQVDGNTAGAVTVGWDAGFFSSPYPLPYLTQNGSIGLTLTFGPGAAGTITTQFLRMPIGWRSGPDNNKLNSGRFGSEWELFHPMQTQEWVQGGFVGATATAGVTIASPVTAIRMTSSVVTTGNVDLRFNVAELPQ